MSRKTTKLKRRGIIRVLQGRILAKLVAQGKFPSPSKIPKIEWTFRPLITRIR